MGVNQAIQAERRPQIIRAAAKVIAENGFQNTTLNAVAKEAGRSKGGVAHYFPTKEEMFSTTFVEFFDDIFCRGRDTRDSFDDPIDRILSFSWVFEKSDQDNYVGTRLMFDFKCMASQNEQYQKFYHDWVSRWLFFVEEDIKLGIRQGVFKTVDVEGTARLISAIYEGIVDRVALDPVRHSEDWGKESLRHAVELLLVAQVVVPEAY